VTFAGNDGTRPELHVVFEVSSKDLKPALCHIIVEKAPDTDLRTMSFYGKKCINNGWSVSWGYNYDGDAGIMTLTKYSTPNLTNGLEADEYIVRRVLNIRFLVGGMSTLGSY
jgi:hypothetical protein